MLAAPEHGQVQLQADGSFLYTPQANYFGPDSFTYQYVNNAGQAASAEVATVSLTITAVNDAPVAQDVAVSTLEDTITTINLIAKDVDNTAASLVFSIKTAPQYGKLSL